jgi:MFS family permease
MSGGTAPAAGRRALGVVLLTLFIDLVGFSIVFPLYAGIMQAYLVQHDAFLRAALDLFAGFAPAATPAQQIAFVGSLLIGVYALAQFIASPWWGRLSDRHGRRPVLVITLLGGFVAQLLWVQASSFGVLVLSRVVAGAMAGNVSTLTAAAADLSERSQRTKVMGMVGAAFGLGFILGPAIGGILHHILPNLAGSWSGAHRFSGVAIAAAALTLLNVIAVLRWFPETLLPERRGAPGHTVGLRGLFMRPVHGQGSLHLAYLCFFVAFSGMEATIVFLASDLLGYSHLGTTGIFVILGLASAATQGGLVRRLAPRWGSRRLALRGFLIGLPGYLMVAAVVWQPSAALLTTGCALIAIGGGMVMPAITGWVSGLTPGESQGLAMGQLRSAGALARFLGPTLAAMAYFRFGAAAPYLVGAFLVLLPGMLLRRTPDAPPA